MRMNAASALSPVLLVMAALMPAVDAVARASATVSLSNGRSLTLDETGFVASPPGPPVTGVDLHAIALRPGESTELAWDYTLSVADEGLRPEPPSYGGCVVWGFPVSTSWCGPPAPGAAGHEAAAAMFVIDVSRTFFGPGPQSPLEWSFDGPSFVSLGTRADDLADAATRSGTTRLHATNPGPYPGNLTVFVKSGAWVLASPIPEPAAWLQVLAGLAMLRVAQFVIRRRGLSST